RIPDYPDYLCYINTCVQL
ncbi:hypothetical protein BESB_033000, partial [Besnoitia besnoiti]